MRLDQRPKTARRTQRRPVAPAGGPNRAFAFRVLALLALIGAMWWLGWRSPWARANTEASVRLLDPPAPAAVAPPVPAPAVAEPTPAEAPQNGAAEPAGRSRGRRARRAPAVDAAPGGDWAPAD